jgi:hypothetical protein
MTLHPIVIAPPPEDRLLCDMVGARALALALEIGLVDAMLAGSCVVTDLACACRVQAAGLASIFAILVGSGAVLQSREGFVPSPALINALDDRDRLLQKLSFLELAARDLSEGLPDLLLDVPGFIARGHVFGLFRYERCLTPTPADIAFTRRWMSYTTALTRYEGGVVAPHLDLARCRSLLDVGGNSGEFARLLCAQHPTLQATIFDLPVVVLIGQAHVAQTSEALRLSFFTGDLRHDHLPSGHDAISFKSMLHDWPLEQALSFLDKAAQALEPGGQIVIFERGCLDWSGGPFPYFMLGNLVFTPFYRSPDVYGAHLGHLGFRNISIRRIDLEMPFYLLTAEKT